MQRQNTNEKNKAFNKKLNEFYIRKEKYLESVENILKMRPA